MAAGKTPEYVAAFAALEQALGSLGWKSGGNLRIEDRWSAGSEEGARFAAKEIIGLKPDVILGQSAAVVQAPAIDVSDDSNCFPARRRSGCLWFRIEFSAA
jgi:hypothetical protein